MKKTAFILVIATIFSFLSPQISQAQNAFSAYGGYSWINGAVGAELQMGYWSATVGMMPTSMPMSGESVQAWSLAVTWYGDTWDASAMYIALGYNFAGYRSETTVNGIYTENVIEGMPVFTVGYKIPLSELLYVKGGIGYGYHSKDDFFTWELLLGIYIFGN